MTETHQLRMRSDHYVACPTEVGGHSWRLLRFNSGRFGGDVPMAKARSSVIEPAPLTGDEVWEQAKRDKQRRAQARAR